MAFEHLLYHLSQTCQDVVGLFLDLADEGLVHLHLVKVVHQVLQLHRRDV